MLVIVSDLHFCDGTASPKNVHPSAFTLLLSEVYEAARRNQATDLDILFLGDVVDLLRTERWFEDAARQAVPTSMRPWADAAALDGARPSPATLDHALAITNEVIATNADAFRALRGEGFDAPWPVRRIYLPGNHDRLYLHDPRIRDAVRKALGAVDETAPGLGQSDGIFAHRVAMPRYGLLARHGHEWDDWNFERFRQGAAPTTYTDEDFLCAPIGDPITTELVARLPFELRRHLDASPAFHGDPVVDDIVFRMQRIEDVRPLVASFRWVFYEANRIGGRLSTTQAAALRVALRETVATIAHEFRALDYYRAWRERHHRMLRLDAAEVLHGVLETLEHVDVNLVGELAQVFERVVDRAHPPDVNREGAAAEDLRALGDSALRYVAYGHTHDPLVVGLRASPTQDLYLNSGTFRAREVITDDKQGFMGCEMYSYLAFYHRGETRDGSVREGPAYEAWTGTRRQALVAGAPGGGARPDDDDKGATPPARSVQRR